jgi:tRNA G46 methylase TrmB
MKASEIKRAAKVLAAGGTAALATDKAAIAFSFKTFYNIASV